MKKIMLIGILLLPLLHSSAQIKINSDSLVYCKWETMKGKWLPVKTISEKMLFEIDKDLLVIKVTGRTGDKAIIEKAYIIDFREMNGNRDKWLFLGKDNECQLYTITLDIPAKKVSFITTRTSEATDTPSEMFYYSISDITINMEPIKKHLEEKGLKKI